MLGLDTHTHREERGRGKEGKTLTIDCYTFAKHTLAL